MTGYNFHPEALAISLSLQPIFARELRDALKFPLIIGGDGVPERHGLSGDQQIVAPNRLSCSFQTRAKRTVRDIRWRLKGQHLYGLQDGFKLSTEPPRPLLSCSILQLRSDDDARANLLLANSSDMPRD